MFESGKVRTDVKVRQKKTGKTTLSLPLSKNSIESMKKHLKDKPQDDFIFRGQKRYTKKPITIQQYGRIIKSWLIELGVEDVNEFSTHSMRKTKSSVIYQTTKNVDTVRRLLGQSSVTTTSAYLGITDESALDLTREINI